MQKKRNEEKEKMKEKMKEKDEEEMKEKKEKQKNEEEKKIFIYNRKVEEKWGMELIEVKWTGND